MQVHHSPYGPVHGQLSPVTHTGTHPLFAGIQQGFQVVRYHSLALCNSDGSPSELPPHLEKIAWTEDGVLMAVGHTQLPVWGVQFHPESVCTQHGDTLLSNFYDLSLAHHTGAAHQAQDNAPPASRGSESSAFSQESIAAKNSSQCWQADKESGRFKVLFRKVEVQVDAEKIYNHLYRCAPAIFHHCFLCLYIVQEDCDEKF